MTAATLLEVRNLKVAYGGIQAVKGISFDVREGELVSLIGANGAGKTTTLKALSGVQPVADGAIEYLGRSIRGQGAWDLVRQGLVMVPEGRGTFTRMTITENLLMGAFVRSDAREIAADIEHVFGLFGPAGLPAATLQRLNRAFVDALNAPDVKARLAVLLAEPSPTTPEQFAAFVKAELAKYERVVKASGAKIE